MKYRQIETHTLAPQHHDLSTFQPFVLRIKRNDYMQIRNVHVGEGGGKTTHFRTSNVNPH